MKDPIEQRVQNQFGGFCTKVLKNEAARIHNEYARLPEGKRAVILLSYFLGMSDREISEHMNVVRQAISKHRPWPLFDKESPQDNARAA
jgi:DNA-directed RNA polymerase specialized sigma24 family protein